MSTKPKQADYDGLWKALPPQATLALIQTYFPGIQFIGKAIPTELHVLLAGRRIDSAFEILYEGLLCLLHLEYQSTVDMNMPWRMFEYAMLLKLQRKQHNLPDIPIVPIVIWAIPPQTTTPSPRYENRVGTILVGYWEYSEIRLTPVHPATASAIELALAPMAPETTVADMEAVATALVKKATPQESLFLLSALVELATWKFGDDFLRIRDIILAKVGVSMSDIYTAIAQTDIGEHFRTEGIAIGEAKGIAEGEAKTLRRQWIKKFGDNLTPDVDAALRTASGEVIEHMLDRLIDPAYTVEQARNDLGL